MSGQESIQTGKKLAALERYSNHAEWLRWEKKTIEDLRWKWPWQLSQSETIVLDSLYGKLQALLRASSKSFERGV